MAIYPTEYKIYNIAGKQRQLKPSGFPKKESANQKNQRKEREKKKDQYQETSGSLCVDSALYPVIGALIIVKMKS